MAKYTKVVGGKTYQYDYDRRRYANNSPEYNKEYYKRNKAALARKKAVRRLLDRIETELKSI